ncbi:fibroblast growth factor receptor substrate 3 [Psammomys obesus]|uniref:fibroblast growth factor receptor substrate 3 n=1 Tax=Psammomys obesus TaxID=48139 RepID=UPI0024533B5F|nr:fibroblast growth factor receptor substrate 3 [Psammomys obesus]XP_055469412.1 fibroblast growth factor receptor substrate 3 [Psammomys obesus]XP_055469422.1 fibroblast growth factor receptor substrate 3 [Psammomys obesus]XP_055469430.1 fibroblast growth factor receptor substrate 3 [Psammomys obesus]
MGSCCSCLDRDSVPHNHPTKFKVTNVDDEGVELGSGVMELTQSELVLHLHQREAVRWPYLCLRRYGYDSNLFSFESGRRCQTGQGIFAFKCSRAEEIFNLLQDLMQCNSINVMEEPVIITRNSHPPELDLPRGPPQPASYTVSSFSNGFPGCPGEGPRFSAPRRPSTSSLRHASLGEESTHTLIASDEQSHTYVNTPTGEEDHRRSRHCLQPLPEGAPFPPQTRGSNQQDPQVFLQPGQVKFVLGPTPAHRQVKKCQSLCPSMHDPPHHNNNNEGPSECLAQPKCTYENVSGGLRQGAGWRLSPEEPGWSGLAHRRAALLHYENLPPLPPVWESQVQPLGREAGDDGDSRDGLTPSSNGFPDGEEDETPLQKPTSTRASARSHSSFPVPLTRRRRGSPRVFNFDFRRPGPEPPRQLNYIQVELKGWGTGRSKGPQNPSVSGAPGPTPHPARSSDSYAVIDLKKTVAMSNLQRALPRDDGTVRKTRHNSTDLPL